MATVHSRTTMRWARENVFPRPECCRADQSRGVERKIRGVGSITSRGNTATAWTMIGGVVGYSVGFVLASVMPNSPIRATELGYLVGALFGAFSILGWVPGITSSHVVELSKALTSIEHLFAKGQITEAERKLLRRRCLAKF
jgi:hypothetical protein